MNLEKADMVVALHPKGDDDNVVTEIDRRIMQPLAKGGIATHLDAILSVCGKQCMIVFWDNEWLLASQREVEAPGLEKIKKGDDVYYTLASYAHLFDNINAQQNFQKQNKALFDERFLMQNAQVAIEISSKATYKKKLTPFIKEEVLQNFGPVQMVGGMNAEGVFLSARLKNSSTFSKILSSSDRVQFPPDAAVFPESSWIVTAAMTQDTQSNMRKIFDTVFTPSVLRQIETFIRKGAIPDFLRVDTALSGMMKGTVYMTKSSSGSVLLGFPTQKKEVATSMQELFVNAFKKHGAYETTQVKLPDGTKSLMLEAHPEEVVSQQQEIASGAILYTTRFKEDTIFSFLTTQTGSLLTDSVFPISTQNKYTSLVRMLLREDPYHIIGCYEDVCGGVAFQGDSVFVKVLFLQSL